MNYTQPIFDMATLARQLAARQAALHIGSPGFPWVADPGNPRWSDAQRQGYSPTACWNLLAGNAPRRTVDSVWRERLLLQDRTNAERLAAWRSRQPYFVGYMEGGR